MGTTSFRREMQICATCRFWKGKRTVETRGEVPFAVRADTARADCGNRPGAGNPPGGRCGCWKKWGRI